VSRADDALIRRLAGEGRSLREIGERVGLSHSQVKRRLAAPAPEPADLAAELEAFAGELEAAGVAGPADLVRRAAAALAAPPAVERDEDEPIDPNAPALTIARGLIGNLRRAQAREDALGNARAAAYASRSLATALPLLARLEVASREDADTVRIPRAEIERAKAALTERVRKIREAGPLLCARCGADLRREAATS